MTIAAAGLAWALPFVATIGGAIAASIAAAALYAAGEDLKDCLDAEEERAQAAALSAWLQRFIEEQQRLQQKLQAVGK